MESPIRAQEVSSELYAQRRKEGALLKLKESRKNSLPMRRLLLEKGAIKEEVTNVIPKAMPGDHHVDPLVVRPELGEGNQSPVDLRN